MTSFAVAIEPAPQPRLAAVVFLVHLAGAAAPWLALADSRLAVALSTLALAGLSSSLACVPGRHCALAALALDGRGCRVLLSGRRLRRRARIGAGARAFASIVFLELTISGRRMGWLLPRGSIPADAFRRLKARIRFSC